MDAKDSIKEWLTQLASGIVSHPEDLRLEVKTDEMGVLYTLSCNAEDSGKVIGRKGSTATAIRTLLTAAGMSKNIRASLKIAVPDFRNP